MPDAQSYHQQWEEHWAAEGSVQPGQKWDAEGAAPRLKRFVASERGQRMLRGKQAVVPGCGRGYDVALLADAGAQEAVGVEISQTAAKVAQDYCSSNAEQPTRCAIKVADWLEGEPVGTFDFGYDYTFFCALHPTMRAQWAAAWRRNLGAGGHLATMMFPLEEEGREGPPWPVSVEAYANALKPEGFACVLQEPVAEAEATVGNRAGKEIFAVWQLQAPGDSPAKL